MNKRLLIGGAITTGILGAASIIPVTAFAATSDTESSTSSSTSDTIMSSFAEKLAEKLGLDQSTVQTAIDSVNTDMKTERDVQETADINAAVTEGTLTQRQADILIALQSITLAKPTDSSTDGTDPSTMTDEERTAERETMQAERQQKIVDSLNEEGLDITLDELSSTLTAAQDAGLRGVGMKFGEGEHHGGGMGMME